MPKILFIDDSLPARMTLREAFEDTEFEVIEAKSGDEAIAMFERNDLNVDMILCDYNMPGKDGLTTMKEIMDACPEGQKIPSVMVTTESSHELKAKGKEIGLHGWILKPFKRKLLLDGVRAILARAQKKA